MDQYVVVELCKRTLKKVKEQVESTPPIALPFVVAGVAFAPLAVLALCVVGVVSVAAYTEYKKMIE